MESQGGKRRGPLAGDQRSGSTGRPALRPVRIPSRESGSVRSLIEPLCPEIGERAKARDPGSALQRALAAVMPRHKPRVPAGVCFLGLLSIAQLKTNGLI